MGATTGSRPRLGVGLGILLAVITVANGLALVIGIESWADEVNHGSELSDLPMLAAVATTLLAAVALVGIGAAWVRRVWGPRLYAATLAIAFVFVLAAAPEAITLITFVPLVLAAVLWWVAEQNW